MKIYFAGSIRGGRENKDLYFYLIKHLTKYGQVLNEYVGNKNLNEFGEKLPDKQIYERDISWLREADVIIAEVSTPSLGVGYEIGKAESLNKKIFCLYKDQKNKRLSAMISGNPNIKVAKYKNLTEALNYIDSFFKSLKNH